MKLEVTKYLAKMRIILFHLGVTSIALSRLFLVSTRIPGQISAPTQMTKILTEKFEGFRSKLPGFSRKRIRSFLDYIRSALFNFSGNKITGALKSPLPSQACKMAIKRRTSFRRLTYQTEPPQDDISDRWFKESNPGLAHETVNHCFRTTLPCLLVSFRKVVGQITSTVINKARVSLGFLPDSTFSILINELFYLKKIYIEAIGLQIRLHRLSFAIAKI